jgi:hypothetical protein
VRARAVCVCARRLCARTHVRDCALLDKRLSDPSATTQAGSATMRKTVGATYQEMKISQRGAGVCKLVYDECEPGVDNSRYEGDGEHHERWACAFMQGGCPARPFLSAACALILIDEADAAQCRTCSEDPGVEERACGPAARSVTSTHFMHWTRKNSPVYSACREMEMEMREKQTHTHQDVRTHTHTATYIQRHT